MQASVPQDIPSNLPASRAAHLLLRAGLTVATAESCTGGLLAGALTEVPGSSAYFMGGVVSYDNKVKSGLLGVPAHLIESRGAVSAEVASEMARRVRDLVRTDIGISITGIAGPSGATPSKPVGTAFIALDAGEYYDVRHFRFWGDRHANRVASVGAALSILVEYLYQLVEGEAHPV